MLRKDREIRNREEILDVLKRCDTVTVSMRDGDGAYAVPVSFGISCENGEATLWFHGAKQGRKVDALNANPNVCVEGHIFHGVTPTQHGITTRYESVIGFGRAECVQNEEALFGLARIVEHYGISDYPLNRCKGLPMTAVYKIRLESLTGKRNLPEE